MERRRISDEELREVVRVSRSVSETLRKLGKRPNGGTHGHFSQRIKKLGISTEHFGGTTYRSGSKKRSAEEILQKIPSDGRRTPGAFLRRALLEIGVPYTCFECGRGPNWRGKKLVLQVDHEDGDRFNNLRENLRFLCPNCHSQTETYGNTAMGNKKAKKFSLPQEPTRWCSGCGKPISNQGKSGLCKSCLPKNSKIEWPAREEILDRLARSNYTVVAKELGVSDNAIRKHLKKFESTG
jgi:Zn finger protein HypA/HybF involved in hydrogenase expression